MGILKIAGIADPECVVLVSSGEETGFAPAGLTHGRVRGRKARARF